MGQTSGHPRTRPLQHRLRHVPPARPAVASRNPRIGLLKRADPDGAELVQQLLRSSVDTLARAWADGEFAFTLAGLALPGGAWRLEPAGTSLAQTAIAALGLLRLPERVQQRALGGEDAQDLVGRLAKQLGVIDDPGEAALVCWAAAEARHGELPHALARLTELDGGDGPLPVVTAAWVVSALTAARGLAEVEEPLAAARGRLLAARDVLFPHSTGPGQPWYRAHVGSFADQIYSVQALARLHRSGDDPEALAAASAVAESVCAAQGEGGQWWWDYDARTGEVVEGYPVCSAHQYAVAPMALLELAEAGGPSYLEPVCQGLHWLVAPPETCSDLILDELPVVWRGVGRRDRRELVRRVRAAVSRLLPGARLAVLDQLWPPLAVDRECRPGDLGWLLYAWLAPARKA